MKSDRLFVGDVYITHHKLKDHELYKENVVLLKTKNGYYVDIEDCDPVDIPYLYMEDQKYNDRILMSNEPSGELFWEMYVPVETIKPYVVKDNKDTVSLFKLRRQLRKNNK